jgi:hypothetical protein
MIMSMLYDINFIIGLLVTLLLTAIVSFYFTQRIEEQNEKISAMSMVVRAMADELSYFRNNMLINSENVVKSVAPSASTNVTTSASTNVTPSSVHVMQGGAQYNEDSKSYVIDLAKMGTTSDINLIQVSDCESDEEDSDSDSDSDSDLDDSDDSGSESVSESGSETDESDSDEDLDINELQELGDNGESQVKSIKINLSNELDKNDEVLDLDISEFTLGDAQAEDAAALSVDDIINSLSISPDDAVKTINVSLDQETEKALMDYKKLPLDKLRALVQEKKLCEDASKMKKKELFTLLGV